jgi:predicted DNA-binding antitoxin AbrB/MazE fold protein
MEKEFAFIGKVERIDVIFKSFCIDVPETILAKLPKGKYRTEGTMNGIPFNLAIQTQKPARKYLTVSQNLLKKIKRKEGEPVEIKFHLVSSEKLDIPEEFLAVLEGDELAEKMFNEFTTGKKRGLIHYISSAKSIDTRIKRSFEMAHKIKTRTLYGQINSKKED